MTAGTAARLATLAGQVARLSTCDALPLSPLALAERAGITPDPWQAAVLVSTASRVLLNCSRQSGKSTIAAIRAVHTAMYEPGALVLLLSPSLRQSGELFKKVLATYRAAGCPVAAEAETRLTLELENGARIVSLPGKESTIRGFSAVRLLLVDKASRVDTDTYHSIRPMLAVSGGTLIAMSTPFGKVGWWADAWHSREDWQRVTVPASDCARIPASFLEEERRAMPEWNYRQEYECAFEDAEGAVFRHEDLLAALSPDVAPLFEVSHA